jgi:hypothetical protein
MTTRKFPFLKGIVYEPEQVSFAEPAVAGSSH